MVSQSYSFSAASYPSTSLVTGQISSSPTCPVGNPTHVTTSGGSKVVSIDLGTAASTLVDAFSSYNTSGTGCPVCHSVSPDGKALVTTGNLWQKWGGGGGNDVGFNQILSGGTLQPIADPPQYSFPWDSATWALAATASTTEYPAASGVEPIEDSRGWPYAAISPDAHYVLQAPNSWGNTRDDISTNNAQDGSYSSASTASYYPSSPPGSGDKRFFVMDTSLFKPVSTWNSSSPTSSFDPSIDYATEAPIASTYTAPSTTTLQASANGTLSVDCVNNGVISLSTGKTLLVKNETGTKAKYNGIYTVTSAGSSSAKWLLTRTTGTDTTGELASDQRFRVDSGKTLGSSAGSSSGQFPIYFRVTSADPITIGTSDLNFALWTTVRAATTAALPGSPSTSSTLTSTGILANAFAASDVLAPGMRVLVKNQSNSAQNGIYSISTISSTSGGTWTLVRTTDMGATNEVISGSRVRVSDGTYGGYTFELTTPSSFTLNGTSTTGAITFTQVAANDSLLNATTMMVPQFSPDGTKLIYVNGDADTVTSSTGWRRGLSMMSVNLNTMSFSNKKRLVNNYSSGTAGNTIKWPFFEHDSRSAIYVQSDPTEFCPRQANYGQCASSDGKTCTSTTASAVIDTDIERACYEGSYGNMSPTTRAYWYGKLHSIDTNNSTLPNPTDVELAWLNNNYRAADATRMAAADADKAYQPTVLPFSAGGYRWVIFTSQRSYGNQVNVVGTHFSCAAALLWMAALDDTTAGTSDRSYPAFLVPGQQMAKITNTYHYVNERGYIVPSPCKAAGSSCSISAECCGGSGSSPTTACSITAPISTPITRTCQSIATCATAGQACTADSDCCVAGSTCFLGACSDPPKYYQATYQRDYSVDCTKTYGRGYRVVWGNFSWHAQAAGSTSIAFSAQSNATGSYSSSDTTVTLGAANSSNINVPPTAALSADVDALFQSASVSTDSFLRVTMTFNPSSDNLLTPTLYDWNLTYTCKPAE